MRPLPIGSLPAGDLTAWLKLGGVSLEGPATSVAVPMQALFGQMLQLMGPGLDG